MQKTWVRMESIEKGKASDQHGDSTVKDTEMQDLGEDDPLPPFDVIRAVAGTVGEEDTTGVSPGLPE